MDTFTKIFDFCYFSKEMFYSGFKYVQKFLKIVHYH